MALTKPTVAAVRVVISTTLTDAGVQAMIDDAELIVRQCPAVADLDTDHQAAIVKWVAAHLISQQGGTAGPLTSKTMGDASESYAAGFRQYGVQLTGSFYGQQALLLETSGCLAKIGKTRAFVQVLSTGDYD